MTATKVETMHEAVARLMDDREAQGLPRHITDPLAIATIAASWPTSIDAKPIWPVWHDP